MKEKIKNIPNIFKEIGDELKKPDLFFIAILLLDTIYTFYTDGFTFLTVRQTFLVTIVILSIILLRLFDSVTKLQEDEISRLETEIEVLHEEESKEETKQDGEK